LRSANEKKTERARNLRQAMTKAEAALWYQLRSRRLNGFKFVRQEPIGPYTVDLICREHRLIIEVDGGQHADNPQDAVRDKWLVDHNYRVLRFWNNDVLMRPQSVMEMIVDVVAQSPSPVCAPSGAQPPSPTRGEGSK